MEKQPPGKKEGGNRGKRSFPYPDRRIDCTGLYCPVPVFNTRKELEGMERGQVLEVLADDPAAEEDIKRLAERIGGKVLLIEKKGEVLRFLIEKGKG